MTEARRPNADGMAPNARVPVQLAVDPATDAWAWQLLCGICDAQITVDNVQHFLEVDALTNPTVTFRCPNDQCQVTLEFHRSYRDLRAILDQQVINGRVDNANQ